MRTIAFLIISVAVSLAPSALHAQDEPAEELHWAGELGKRSFEAERRIPTVDQVVLVPDAATYLDEIGRWSPAGRWPVLIEDESLTPMFIRRFGPAHVFRRESVGDLQGSADLRLQNAQRIVRHAWGGGPLDQSITAVLERNGTKPTGLVLTSMDDPAWTAAVALAAGRGQILDQLGGFHRLPNAGLDLAEAERLRAAVRAALIRSGLTFDTLGDDIDAITICRNIAGVARSNHPDAKPPGRAKQPLIATTDLVGRDPTGRRFACAGWVFGSETRSAYVAMSSLFLTRQRAWLFDSYGGTPERYALEATREFLEGVDIDVHGITTNATLNAWRQVATRPLAADMLFVNTRGNVNFFETASGRGETGDIPIPRGPAIVHFIHSWSMARAADSSTIGARWLDHGVYAMVGSVQEPYLGAFVPAGEVARRCAAGVPFLVAVRWWPNQGTGNYPWRIQTYGDPLMLARPFPAPPRFAARAPDNATDIASRIRSLLQTCRDTPSDEAFGDAVRTLILLRRYDVAIRLWETSDAQGMSLRSSRAVLPAVFESGTDEQLVRAWMELGARDAMAIDMLWLRLKPSLGAQTPDDVLLLLQSVVRQDIAVQDLTALRPYLRGRFGNDHFTRQVQRFVDAETRPGKRRALEALLKPGR